MRVVLRQAKLPPKLSDGDTLKVTTGKDSAKDIETATKDHFTADDFTVTSDVADGTYTYKGGKWTDKDGLRK